MRLIEDDDSRELRNDQVRRLRNILAVLIAAADISGVTGPPGWRVRQLGRLLTNDRRSLSIPRLREGRLFETAASRRPPQDEV